MLTIHSSTQLETQLAEEIESKVLFPWNCILFNDDFHSFDEVIFQIMKAINCSNDKAESMAIEVHNKGKAVIFSGEIEECVVVSTILEEIFLLTEIQG